MIQLRQTGFTLWLIALMTTSCGSLEQQTNSETQAILNTKTQQALVVIGKQAANSDRQEWRFEIALCPWSNQLSGQFADDQDLTTGCKSLSKPLSEKELKKVDRSWSKALGKDPYKKKHSGSLGLLVAAVAIVGTVAVIASEEALEVVIDACLDSRGSAAAICAGTGTVVAIVGVSLWLKDKRSPGDTDYSLATTDLASGTPAPKPLDPEAFLHAKNKLIEILMDKDALAI